MLVPPASNVLCASLGTPIPPGPYATSVSLPTWRDSVGFKTGEKRVLDAIDNTGYPQVVIHKSIKALAAILEQKHGRQGTRCFLFPKASIANHCRDYVLARSPDDNPLPTVHLMKISIDPKANLTTKEEKITLYLVFVPEEASNLPKAMWLHVGLGITNRMADRCLALLEDGATTCIAVKDWDIRCELATTGELAQNRRRGSDGPSAAHTTCFLNGHGHNIISLAFGMVAKQVLRRRIANLVTYEASSFKTINVCEDDVYLFPNGMASIWNAHQLFLNTFPPAPSVCFGFPHMHTLRIVQQWGPGHYFFDKGDKADIGSLESLLSPPDAPQILVLFCEFPSNPLLQSPDSIRLRGLADRYGFPMVIDGTIGNFVNVDILPFADILVNSLTKAFSGQANVMGGSFVLNPKSRYYSVQKPKMEAIYEDSYWDDDPICMERNSRDFVERLRVMNENAEAVCDLLHSKVNEDNSVVKRVYYPKTETRAVYDVYRRSSPTSSGGKEGDNYGGLLSVSFTSFIAAMSFYDALPCAKSPSFGTNFTLACPYTVMVHYSELAWAAACGVEEGLVRISVGLEDQEPLLDWIRTSLKCAEEAFLEAT